MTLRKKTFSGVRWTSFSSLSKSILYLVQISILARILEPEDFGLLAIVVAITMVLQIFSDAGMSNALIHFQKISPDQLSSLYWLNMIISLVLASILVCISSLLSSWYDEPKLQYLLYFSAAILIVGAISQQIRVIAQKNFQFRNLAKVELIATIFGFLISIGFAWLGLGVYSLVCGILSMTTILTLLSWLWLANNWKPIFRLKINEIKKFLSFGAFMIGNNLANAINSQIDVLIGAQLLGSHAIGLYNIPKEFSLRISGVINPIVTRVSMPIMANSQEDLPKLKIIYLQTLRMTASVSFPLYVALSIFSTEIVYILWGEQWNEAASLLEILAIWALIRSTGNPVGSLLMAKGRADLSFKWNMIWLLFLPPCIYLGSYFGISGIVMAMLGMSAIAFLPNWYFLIFPLTGITLREYILQLLIPLLISLFAGLFGSIASSFLSSEFLCLFVGVVVGGISYCCMSWVFNRIWIDTMKELLIIRK